MQIYEDAGNVLIMLEQVQPPRVKEKPAPKKMSKKSRLRAEQREYAQLVQTPKQPLASNLPSNLTPSRQSNLIQVKHAPSPPAENTSSARGSSLQVRKVTTSLTVNTNLSP